MSGKSIDKILNNAYQTVGSILGYTFQVYRSVDFITPIQTKNYLKDCKIAFAIDNNFEKQQEYNFNLFNIFTNTTTLQNGDILVNEELDKIFVLAAKDPIAYPRGISCNGTISINRAIYNTTNGFGPKQEEIATNVPGTILESGSAQDKAALLHPSPLKTGIRTWEMWMWLPHNNIRINDVLTDNNGNVSFVTSVQYSELGYKIKSQSVKVGA